jgi:hypothetical protein
VKLPPGYVSIDVYTWTRSVPEKTTPDVDQRLFMDEIK